MRALKGLLILRDFSKKVNLLKVEETTKLGLVNKTIWVKLKERIEFCM